MELFYEDCCSKNLKCLIRPPLLSSIVFRGNTPLIVIIFQDYPTAIDYHLKHLKIAKELFDKVSLFSLKYAQTIGKVFDKLTYLLVLAVIEMLAFSK